jgi:excisionase family DNA binding protein
LSQVRAAGCQKRLAIAPLAKGKPPNCSFSARVRRQRQPTSIPPSAFVAPCRRDLSNSVPGRQSCIQLSQKKQAVISGAAMALALLKKESGVLPMEKDSENLRLLTLSQAAELLHVSTRTLQRMIRRNDLPAFKVGGQWRVRESQLAHWIQFREGGDAVREKDSGSL